MNELDNKNSAENKAEQLNNELFSGAETVKHEAEKSKRKPENYPKGIFKTIGIVALAAVMAFTGAFFGIVMVCQTAILGDSDFFKSIVVANSGVALNKVEMDYITGEYLPTDTTELAEKIRQCTVEIRLLSYNAEENTYSDGANGSGVIIAYDESTGYATIVTNYHVMYGAKAFNVVLHNKDTYTGELLHLDQIGDLAVVRIKTDRPVTPATIADSSKLVIGQQIAAAGNPLGLGLSVSYGYLSYPERDIGDEGGSYIQADISVNPGNSGGGLYDYAGNLIGIVTAKASGTNVDGIGYAIPSNRMVESVNELLKYGYVKGRPALGVTVVTVSASTWDYFNQNDLAGMLDKYNYGVYVIAAKYYPELILKGDKIVSIDGKDLTTKEELSAIILKHKAGDTITLKIQRGTKDADGNFSFEVINVSIELRERDWADENVTE